MLDLASEAAKPGLEVVGAHFAVGLIEAPILNQGTIDTDNHSGSVSTLEAMNIDRLVLSFRHNREGFFNLFVGSFEVAEGDMKVFYSEPC